MIRFLLYVRILFSLFLCPVLIFSAHAEQTTSSSSKHRVLLARTWDGKTDVTGWWVSEKLDGVRAYWTGKELISRSGKPFNHPAHFTHSFPPTPLDGELWIGRGQFQKLLGIVRTQTTLHPNWSQVRYYIFDAPKTKGVFEQRIKSVRNWLEQHPSPYVVILKQQRCQSNRQLLLKLDQVTQQKGEGLMLRKPASLYETGRSNTLLKVKKYEDREATIVGYRKGKGKYKGLIGAFIVELPNGIQFAIGSGLSETVRSDPPKIGTVITFKHYGYTQKGVPRFASFLRIWEKM